MARQHNRLPADSDRMATRWLVVFCYRTNKETNKSILSRFSVMPLAALRSHVFVCSVFGSAPKTLTKETPSSAETALVER